MQKNSQLYKKLNEQLNSFEFNIHKPSKNLFFSNKELIIDLRRNFLNEKILNIAANISKSIHLKDQINALFSGKRINITENRNVQHVSLRNNDFSKTNYLKKTMDFAKKIRSGSYLSSSKKKFNCIINIGIGGSDLGPKTVFNFLKENYPQNNDIKNVYFLSNIDSKKLKKIISQIEIEKTLFLISSKSFKTQETLVNTKFIINLLKKEKNKDKIIKKNFICITSEKEIAIQQGFNPELIFEIPLGIGGRFSLWSPISLINIIIFGPNIYREMVKGATEIDNHFLNTPFKKNIPFLLAFLSFIHINFLKNLAHGYLIYSNYLEDFIPYLQQLEMESLGKSYQRSNIISKYKTSPIVWGGIGTNCQHAFMQQVHQGNIGSNFDLILTLNNDDKKDSLDKFMFANYLAQSDTLISGNLNSQSNFKKIIGGKGHSIIILKNMRAKNLGSLISLYENKVFALSCILNINAFDQWGVEEGKKIANEYIRIIDEKQGTKKNSLLNEILKNTKN